MDLSAYKNPVEQDRAVNAITNAINDSLILDGQQKGSEIKRRFGMALGILNVMRNDLGWSWTRIEDNLSTALRSYLDNGDWTPPSRNAWSASPTSGLILPPGVK